MKKLNKKWFFIAAVCLVVGGATVIGYNRFFASAVVSTPCSQTQVQSDSRQLKISIDTGNLDVKNIQEEELHLINQEFISRLKTIPEVEVSMPTKMSNIALTANKDNFERYKKTKHYDVRMGDEFIGEQEVNEFQSTNILDVFYQKTFSNTGHLIEGGAPVEASEEFQILIPKEFQDKENLKIGDEMTVFSNTINGEVEKQAKISGVYEFNKGKNDLCLGSSRVYTNLQHAAELFFFNDDSFESISVEVAEDVDIEKIKEEIKKISGVREEILLFEQI